MEDWKWEGSEYKQDHWLPRKNMPQVQSHRVDTMADAKVEILINGDKALRSWFVRRFVHP